MQEIEDGFSALSGKIMKGIVGAIDGIAIKLSKPRMSDCPNPADYFCRKGFYSLNVQAICDSNRQFRWVSSCCTGATHDSTAYGLANLRDHVDNGDLNFDDEVGGIRYRCIIGDDAYSIHKGIVTPYSSRSVVNDSAVSATAKDSFNFWHSSSRIRIECAFGELTTRWRILGRPLQVALKRAGVVVAVCMLLQNFCITTSRIAIVKDVHTCALKEEHLVDEQNCTAVGMRDSLSRMLESAGMVRPAHSSWGRSRKRANLLL